MITNSLETNEKENVSKEIRGKEGLPKTPKLQTTQCPSVSGWLNKLGCMRANTPQQQKTIDTRSILGGSSGHYAM